MAGRRARRNVVNFEEGAELSVSDGDERNEGAYELVEEVENYPDLCQSRLSRLALGAPRPDERGRRAPGHRQNGAGQSARRQA